MQNPPNTCVNSLRPSDAYMCEAIISSDNGLLPGLRQAIIWTNDDLLSIGPLGTNFSEILFEIKTFPFKKMHSNMPSTKWRPFLLGLNVLILLIVAFKPFKVLWYKGDMKYKPTV